MLIVYRTNTGFEGDIVSLDFDTPAAAMDAYLAQAQEPVNLAYLEVNEGALDGQVFADLVASVRGFGTRGRFYVADVGSVISLVDGGA